VGGRKGMRRAQINQRGRKGIQDKNGEEIKIEKEDIKGIIYSERVSLMYNTVMC
jgi:hypothetical protein